MFDEPRDEYDSDILCTNKQYRRIRIKNAVTFPLWILSYVAEKIYRIFKPVPTFEDVYNNI